MTFVITFIIAISDVSGLEPCSADEFTDLLMKEIRMSGSMRVSNTIQIYS